MLQSVPGLGLGDEECSGGELHANIPTPEALLLPLGKGLSARGPGSWSSSFWIDLGAPGMGDGVAVLLFVALAPLPHGCSSTALNKGPHSPRPDFCSTASCVVRGAGAASSPSSKLSITRSFCRGTPEPPWCSWVRPTCRTPPPEAVLTSVLNKTQTSWGVCLSKTCPSKVYT